MLNPGRFARLRRTTVLALLVAAAIGCVAAGARASYQYDINKCPWLLPQGATAPLPVMITPGNSNSLVFWVNGEPTNCARVHAPAKPPGEDVKWIFNPIGAEGTRPGDDWVMQVTLAPCLSSTTTNTVPLLANSTYTGAGTTSIPVDGGGVMDNKNDTCFYNAFAVDLSTSPPQIYSGDPTVIVGGGHQGTKPTKEIILMILGGIGTFVVGGAAGFKMKSMMMAKG
jgi:hypothetical protein